MAVSIDDLELLGIVRPQSAAEVGELAREASAKQQALYPIGGGTMLGLGLPPSKPGVAVDLRGLDQVIDYPARDMTITAQAGLTIAKLQAMLAPENQRLPIDVPQAERATLGGIIAANVSGPRRLGVGTLRDYVIGISFINDRGEEVKGGGRVVKNVAGYDMPKLHIGALGTLGIITQVTLKLKPLPEEQALVDLPCAEADLEATLNLIHQSRTRPACVELLNPAAVGSSDDRWRVLIGYEDNRAAVGWQVEQLKRELGARETMNQLEWKRLAEFPSERAGVLTFKANLLSSATANFCHEVNRLRPGLSLQAHAASGIVIGHAERLDQGQATAFVEQVRGLAAKGQGSVVVLNCPSAWKRTLSVWGPARGDLALMRAIKQQLDPRGIFNPGRFIDGL